MREKKNGDIKYSLPDHIWEILQDNLQNGNPFLTDSQIAIRVNNRILNHFPNDRYADHQILAKTIRSQMGHVRNIADREGCTIVADRKRASDDGKTLKGWIILGWHIADADDGDYIRREIDLRIDRGAHYITSASQIEATAKDQGLIPEEEKPTIGETPALEE